MSTSIGPPATTPFSSFRLELLLAKLNHPTGVPVLLAGTGPLSTAPLCTIKQIILVADPLEDNELHQNSIKAIVLSSAPADRGPPSVKDGSDVALLFLNVDLAEQKITPALLVQRWEKLLGNPDANPNRFRYLLERAPVAPLCDFLSSASSLSEFFFELPPGSPNDDDCEPRFSTRVHRSK